MIKSKPNPFYTVRLGILHTQNFKMIRWTVRKHSLKNKYFSICPVSNRTVRPVITNRTKTNEKEATISGADNKFRAIRALERVQSDQPIRSSASPRRVSPRLNDLFSVRHQWLTSQMTIPDLMQITEKGHPLFLWQS